MVFGRSFQIQRKDQNFKSPKSTPTPLSITPLSACSPASPLFLIFQPANAIGRGPVSLPPASFPPCSAPLVFFSFSPFVSYRHPAGPSFSGPAYSAAYLSLSHSLAHRQTGPTRQTLPLPPADHLSLPWRPHRTAASLASPALPLPLPSSPSMRTHPRAAHPLLSHNRRPPSFNADHHRLRPNRLSRASSPSSSALYKVPSSPPPPRTSSSLAPFRTARSPAGARSATARPPASIYFPSASQSSRCPPGSSCEGEQLAHAFLFSPRVF
jgi:hypothetical protein